MQTTGGEVWKHHVDQIGEVGDPGSVLSEEELIPTVERPTEEPLSEIESTREHVLMSKESLSEMDGTRENPVPSLVSLPPREALAILPLPNEEGTETLPLPNEEGTETLPLHHPPWIQKKCCEHRARKYHQLVDTHRG